MFITEKTNTYFNEASANPAYMYEAILEANEAYQDLCIRMIKCEHTAIVTENATLLAEAEQSFGQRVKKIAQTLLAKFIAFVDRVRAEWSKLWSSVLTSLVDKEKTRYMAENASKNNITVEADIEGIKGIMDIFNNAGKISTNNEEAAMEDITELFNKVKTFAEHQKKGAKKVAASDVNQAVDFLEARPKMISTLETIKSCGKSLAGLASKLEEGSVDQIALAKFSSLISRIIVRINSYTSDAVRICRACLKQAKGNKGYKEANEKYKNRNADHSYDGMNDALSAFGSKKGKK